MLTCTAFKRVITIHIPVLMFITTSIQKIKSNDDFENFESEWLGPDRSVIGRTNFPTSHILEQSLIVNQTCYTISENGTQLIFLPIHPSSDEKASDEIIDSDYAEVLKDNAKINKSQTVNRTRRFRVKYTLYNIKYPNGEQILIGNKSTTKKWLAGQKTVIIINGWLPSGEIDHLMAVSLESSLKIKDAYIQSGRRENLVVVNWRSISSHYIDNAAAEETYFVGIGLAYMIMFLKTENLLQYSRTKLVGFALGAHVAGVAGDFIHTHLDTKIGEITGLDPAGPWFEGAVSLKRRLDKTDADFVQIIHCNMGCGLWLLFNPHFGSNLAEGDVDFYPNGGCVQPSCTHDLSVIRSFCSHIRCCELYASTIRKVRYKGCECGNIENFMEEGGCVANKSCKCNGPLIGDLCPTTASGKYCMVANPHPLYKKEAPNLTPDY